MNNMTFKSENGYVVAYINGKEVGRAKLSEIGLTEQDVLSLIEGNPSDEATEVLNKLKIGDTVYSTGGSGDSDIYELQADDITVTGQSQISPEGFEATLSQDLLNVLNGNKKGVYVNATLMSAFTSGDITYAVCFNTIKEIDVSQFPYTKAVELSNTSCFGETLEAISVGFINNNGTWNVIPMTSEQNFDLLKGDISNLDIRVSALEGVSFFRNEITVSFHKGFNMTSFSFIIYSTSNINTDNATFVTLSELIFQNTIRDSEIYFTDFITGEYDGSTITLRRTEYMSLGSDISSTTDYSDSTIFTVNEQNSRTGISEVYDITNDVSISQNTWTSCEVSITSHLITQV